MEKKVWKRWELEDEYRLVELRVTGAQYSEIAQALGRSLDSVKKRAAHMQKLKTFAEYAEEFGINY